MVKNKLKLYQSILFLFFLILPLFLQNNCKKNNPQAFLNITTADWFLTQTQDGFGFIKLYISGNTNGDKVTILTLGDGLLNEVELQLSAGKTFDEVVTISFSHLGYTPPIQAETIVKAYLGDDYVERKLESGDIW